MRITGVEYLTPKTFREACSLGLRYKERARIMAGGTDVLAQMKKGQGISEFIIDIKGCADGYIQHGPDGLRISALATIHSVATSAVILERFAALAKGASVLGSSQVRRQATIGGNIANAAVSADTLPALMVLEAKLLVAGPRGEKLVPIAEFFTGPSETVLKPGQVLKEIQIADLPTGTGSAYIKQTLRRAMDLSITDVAVLLTMDGNKVKEARIALGTSAPTVIRAREAEALLKGKEIDEAAIEKAAVAAVAGASPRDSMRASAAYRRQVIATLVKRAVMGAAEGAKR